MARKPKKKRRGPGRPPRTEPVERLTVLLPPRLKKSLRLKAVEEGRDMSAIAADALRAYLKRAKRSVR